MEITVRNTNRGWCKPSQGARYAGVSVRVFRRWLKNGLEHSQTPSGRIFVRYRAIDAYLEQFIVENEAKAMAEELTQDL